MPDNKTCEDCVFGGIDFFEETGFCDHPKKLGIRITHNKRFCKLGESYSSPKQSSLSDFIE